jgi:hypothetical protein
MKRIAFFALSLALMSLTLVSCKPEEVKPDETAANLQAIQGVWTVDHVDVNYFDYLGNLSSTDRVDFGENTEGGLSTFSFVDKLIAIDDNGDIFESGFTVEDNVIYTDGGGTWGLRSKSDTKLEVVLQASASTNPCSVGSSGSVYTLTRSAQR